MTGVALPPENLKTGVDITPMTRNETPSKAAFSLAKDGVALAPIVIAENAGPQTKLAVEEMKKVLDQISGAEFKIVTGDGRTGVVVGTIEEFPVPALAKALEIRHSMDGKEAFAIRTDENRVLLVGATDLAASHAVYRFLDELGCRWFFPDATGDWTVIPKLKIVKFHKDITDRPAFLERRIWYAWSTFYDPGHPLGKDHGSDGDLANWARRNSMSASFVTNTGHAYEMIARENAAEFEKHPEYWALVGEKRQGPQFELGNPGLRQLVIDWAVDYFKKNPTADMVSVDPADGAGVSESPEAKAYGTASDSAFKLANEVAVALQKAYPGQNKMVGLYAYNWHSDPPPFALQPNVYIQLTMGFNGGKLTLDELFEEWPKKARNLGFYDYYSTWRWDYDMWPGGRVGSRYYAPSMINRFQKANAQSQAYATSISAESSGNWGPNGRGYYLANKLMWNPNLDLDAVLDDFYAQAFGPAAAAMKTYYSYQDSSPPISPGLVGSLFGAIKQARDAAKGNEAVMKRLDDITTYLHYYDMGYRGGEQNDAERWRTAYRSRYHYMNHWAAIYNDALGNNTDPNAAWRDETPITRSEIEGWLDDAIAHYPVLKIPAEVKFSEDLVPVVFGEESVDWGTTFQEGSQYIFYSNGAPIKVNIVVGGAHGLNKSFYKFSDYKGKVLKEGKPQMGDKLDLVFPVPAPGLYKFLFHDAGAYGEVHIGKGHTVVLPVTAQHFRAMAPVPDLYFYVPKGTQEINYYYKRADWQYGGAHQLTDASGTVVKEVAVDGDYVSIPVPAGQDGKVWKIGGPTFGLGGFRFFNIPNYFSPNPNTLLLPRELVTKDGLKVAR